MALNLTNKQLIPNNTDKAVIFISLPCLYIPILFALAFAQLLAVSLLLFRFLIYTLFPYLLCKPSAPCLGRQPVIFAVPLIALSLILVRRRFNARRSPSLPRLAASLFLLLLSSPPFLSPPPPIPPCALAFLRQALRRPLLAKPPLCLGRQPVTRAQTTVYPPKNKEKRPLFKKKRENIWLFPEKCVPLHSLSRTGHLATRF